MIINPGENPDADDPVWVPVIAYVTEEEFKMFVKSLTKTSVMK